MVLTSKNMENIYKDIQRINKLDPEWYPKLLEKEIKAEKDFDNWLQKVNDEK